MPPRSTKYSNPSLKIRLPPKRPLTGNKHRMDIDQKSNKTNEPINPYPPISNSDVIMQDSEPTSASEETALHRLYSRRASSLEPILRALETLKPEDQIYIKREWVKRNDLIDPQTLLSERDSPKRVVFSEFSKANSEEIQTKTNDGPTPPTSSSSSSSNNNEANGWKPITKSYGQWKYFTEGDIIPPEDAKVLKGYLRHPPKYVYTAKEEAYFKSLSGESQGNAQGTRLSPDSLSTQVGTLNEDIVMRDPSPTISSDEEDELESTTTEDARPASPMEVHPLEGWTYPATHKGSIALLTKGATSLFQQQEYCNILSNHNPIQIQSTSLDYQYAHNTGLIEVGSNLVSYTGPMQDDWYWNWHIFGQCLNSLLYKLHFSEPPLREREPIIWTHLGVIHCAIPQYPSYDAAFLSIRSMKELQLYQAKMFAQLATIQASRLVLAQMARKLDWPHASDILNMELPSEPVYYFLHDKWKKVTQAMKTTQDKKGPTNQIGYNPSYGRQYDFLRMTHMIMGVYQKEIQDHFLRHCTGTEGKSFNAIYQSLLNSDLQQSYRAQQNFLNQKHLSWDDYLNQNPTPEAPRPKIRTRKEDPQVADIWRGLEGPDPSKFLYSDINPVYQAKNGVLYYKNKKGHIHYYDRDGQILAKMSPNRTD
ncbi:hypothetical protein CPB86DRAFT_860236 [Serendipita vermifera]|nr:hypothetical protein CPB86DRAFT_860236 [Serendipita vermifera]